MLRFVLFVAIWLGLLVGGTRVLEVVAGGPPPASAAAPLAALP